MVGGDRAVEVELDALPARVAESLRAPCGREVAVERGRGPVFGPERVRVAVRGRDDALHADLIGRGQRGGLLAREHFEARVAAGRS